MKKGDKVEVYIFGEKYKDGIFIENDIIPGLKNRINKVEGCRILIDNEVYLIPKINVKEIKNE